MCLLSARTTCRHFTCVIYFKFNSLAYNYLILKMMVVVFSEVVLNCVEM